MLPKTEDGSRLAFPDPNMNPIRPSLIGLAVCSSVFAIEAPEDKAPPPPEAIAAERNARPSQSQPSPDARVLRPPAGSAAFLGVYSEKVPDLLAEHLGIAAGGGVVIRSLAPEGPAAKAGLAVNDLITRVSGNAVASPEDLTREISKHQPGDVVKLDVIRKGKPSPLEVTLAARPGVRSKNTPAPEDRAADLLGEDWSGRLRDTIERQLGEFGLRPDSRDGIAPGHELRDVIDHMRERMEKLMGPLSTPDVVPDVPHWQGEVESTACIRMLDAQGSVEIRSVAGSKEVVVRDPNNRVVWSGPWESEQDKAAAPADVRARIERLPYKLDLNGGGFRMRFGGPESE
jgi:membrane-associated protease RseP (regulator of RpoE activity)